MENDETKVFADQRLTEIIRDGISLDQELMIEQLQKQLIIAQTQAQQAISVKEHMLKEIQRYQLEFQQIKAEMDQLQSKYAEDLSLKKQKHQAK